MTLRLSKQNKLLLFGYTGELGNSIANYYLSKEWEVVGVSRSRNEENILQYDNITNKFINSEAVINKSPFDAVCWAQGQNCEDSIFNFDLNLHISMYEANIVYIIKTLHYLLSMSLLAKPSRLCLVSSIWQNMARQNKLSYCVTKSAIRGLVSSLAVDLGKDGHLINAVLPGVMDTPMTRANLDEDQINKIIKSTTFARLASLNEVAKIIYSLTSSENTCVTGEFIKTDLGYSNGRIV